MSAGRHPCRMHAGERRSLREELKQPNRLAKWGVEVTLMPFFTPERDATSQHKVKDPREGREVLFGVHLLLPF